MSPSHKTPSTLTALPPTPTSLERSGEALFRSTASPSPSPTPAPDLLDPLAVHELGLCPGHLTVLEGRRAVVQQPLDEACTACKTITARRAYEVSFVGPDCRFGRFAFNVLRRLVLKDVYIDFDPVSFGNDVAGPFAQLEELVVLKASERDTDILESCGKIDTLNGRHADLTYALRYLAVAPVVGALNVDCLNDLVALAIPVRTFLSSIIFTDTACDGLREPQAVEFPFLERVLLLGRLNGRSGFATTSSMGERLDLEEIVKEIYLDLQAGRHHERHAFMPFLSDSESDSDDSDASLSSYGSEDVAIRINRFRMLSALRLPRLSFSIIKKHEREGPKNGVELSRYPRGLRTDDVVEWLRTE